MTHFKKILSVLTAAIVVILASATALALAALLATSRAQADDYYSERYWYVSAKVGTFINGCTSSVCNEPDGHFPAWISVGHRWVDVKVLGGNVDIDVAVWQHRSNYDIGFPRPGETGVTEYNRDGPTIEAVYKFGRK